MFGRVVASRETKRTFQVETRPASHAQLAKPFTADQTQVWRVSFLDTDCKLRRCVLPTWALRHRVFVRVMRRNSGQGKCWRQNPVVEESAITISICNAILILEWAVLSPRDHWPVCSTPATYNLPVRPHHHSIPKTHLAQHLTIILKFCWIVFILQNHKKADIVHTI